MTTISLDLSLINGVRTGIGNYVYEITKRLSNDNNIRYQGNFINFLGRRDNTQLYKNYGINICENKLFPGYGIYSRIWNYIPFGYSSIFNRSDVNVFFNYIVPPRVRGIVVDTIYDLAFIRHPSTLDKKNLRRIQKGIEESVRRSSLIITISEFSKSEIASLLNVDPNRIHVIPCAPMVSKVTTDFNRLKDKYNITKPYILYLGTIEPRKNILRMIQTYNILRDRKTIDYQFVLGGSIGWNSDDIITQINESRYKDDIKILGYVESSDLNLLYSNAKVFFFPSLYEGFGMPPLDAMMLKCPVVTSNCSALPEVVGDAAVLVNPYDLESLTDGLSKVLLDDTFSKALVSKGLSRVSKYSWNDSSKKFDNILRSCVRINA